MSFESLQERFQSARNDHSEGQAAALRIRAQRPHGARWELECDGYCRLGHLDGPFEPTGFFEIPVCLTQRQVELAREAPRSLGQFLFALEQPICGIQMQRLVRLRG